MCYVCIEWYDKYILVVCDEDTIMIRQIGAFLLSFSVPSSKAWELAFYYTMPMWQRCTIIL